MASLVYTTFATKLLNGGAIDLDSDTIKVALLSSSYTPNQDAHDFFDDVSTYEITGTGYTAGGAALSNKTVTQDNTNNRVDWTADTVTWTSSSLTARYGVIYKVGGTPGASPLICLIDFGSDIVSSDSTFTLSFNASGILRLSIV